MMEFGKYFIDYLNNDFFKYCCLSDQIEAEFTQNTINYIVTGNLHEKYFSCYYAEPQNTYYYWMDLFDYTKYPEMPKFIDIFDDFMNNCFAPFLSCQNINENMILSIIDKYRYYVSIHPYFLSYFKLLQGIMQSYWNNSEQSTIKSKTQEIYSISKEFKKNYFLMKDYIYYVLIFHTSNGLCVSPQISKLMYDYYLEQSGNINIFKKSFFSHTVGFAKETLLLEDFMKDEDRIQEFSDFGISFNTNPFMDYSYGYTFAYQLNQLIASDMVLVQCPNCKRLFLKKYSSTTTYCNNIYRNTKATCQESASRKNYQKRLKDNPIQAEYYRVKSRMYMQVKRGRIDIQQARLDELRELRDLYLAQYSVCNLPQETDSLIQQFKNSINQLYQ